MFALTMSYTGYKSVDTICGYRIHICTHVCGTTISLTFHFSIVDSSSLTSWSYMDKKLLSHI